VLPLEDPEALGELDVVVVDGGHDPGMGSQEDLGHVSRDGLFSERPGGRDPVMPVGDVVVAVQPVDLDGWKRLSLDEAR
jgi:hypothetical protein